MTDHLHVHVTLSPESIAALGAFLLSSAGSYREPRRAPVLLREEQGSGQTAAVRAALEGRASVTIRELAAALDVPPERQTRALATGLGIELRALGWSPSQRGGGGLRERVYRPTSPVVG